MVNGGNGAVYLTVKGIMETWQLSSKIRKLSRKKESVVPVGKD